MSRKTGWMLGLAALAVGLGLSVSEVVGQRERPDGPPGAKGEGPPPGGRPEMMRPFAPMTPGRYQVAKATDDFIILLDTATGELYKTPMSEVKSSKERPRMMEMARPVAPDGPRPNFERPRGEGDRPREIERPRGEGDRPRKEGERRPEAAPRPDGERKPERKADKED